MTRIYTVKVNGKAFLVRAATRGGAIRHFAAKMIDAKVATQDEVYTLAHAGDKVEDATGKVK